MWTKRLGNVWAKPLREGPGDGLRGSLLFGIFVSLLALFSLWVVLVQWEGAFDVAVVAMLAGILYTFAGTLLLMRRDAKVAAALTFCLVAKLAATWVLTSSFSNDAQTYFWWSSRLTPFGGHAENLLSHWWGSAFVIDVIVGLFSVAGISFPLFAVAFGLLSYWAQYLYYRIFVTAFPAGHSSRRALVLFLFPSVIFWSSSGKDALSMMSVALISYGFARGHRNGVLNWWPVVAGVALGMCVRPHVAALEAVGVAVACLFGKSANSGARGKGGRIVAGLFVVLLAGAVLFVASRQLKIEDTDQANNFAEKNFESNQRGAGAFGAHQSIGVRLALAPLLMFRPLPFEAHNLTSLAASIEGVLLLGYVFLRRKRIMHLWRFERSQRLVVFALSFLLFFHILYSITQANFGTLVRYRVMALPLFLILVVSEPSWAAAEGQTNRCSDRMTLGPRR
jgi:hypothetical protein